MKVTFWPLRHPVCLLPTLMNVASALWPLWLKVWENPNNSNMSSSETLEGFQFLQKTYGHSLISSKGLPGWCTAHKPASADRCAEGCPCSSHYQDPSEDTQAHFIMHQITFSLYKSYRCLHRLRLAKKCFTPYPVIERKSSRWIHVSSNLAPPVEHITRLVIMRQQRKYKACTIQEGWRRLPLKNKENEFVFGTYVVWYVRIGVIETGITGETVLANFNRSGSRHQAVDVGDGALSEYVKQIDAVVTDLQVFGEGRQQIKREDGTSSRFKHRRVDSSSSSKTQRRALLQFVSWAWNGEV